MSSRWRGEDGAYVAALLGSAATVACVGWLAPSVSAPPLPAFALAYAAVSAEMVVFARYAPARSARVAWLLCAACLIALLGLARALATPTSALLVTVLLGTGGSQLGAAVGARIEKPGQLTAVALVSGIADLWSVFDPSAPSARLAEQVTMHPEQLSLFALPFPLLGSPLVPGIIGAGDLVFAALYVSAFRAHGLSLRRVSWALVAGFAIGLVGLVVLVRPLPLLPLLGAAVLLAEPATRSLTPREWRTVLSVGAALLAALCLRLCRNP